ncbi:MAG: response regulator, partial [Methanosarcinales archaeon]
SFSRSRAQESDDHCADVYCSGSSVSAVCSGSSNPYASYHLILLDIGMPRSNGVYVAQHLRQHGYTGRLIAMTANKSPDDIALYRVSGFDGVLPKPFMFEAVEHVVKDVVRCCAV